MEIMSLFNPMAENSSEEGVRKVDAFRNLKIGRERCKGIKSVICELRTKEFKRHSSGRRSDGVDQTNT